MMERMKNDCVCTDDIRGIYPEIEKQCMPIIKWKAAWYSRAGKVEMEDAIQEGRMAILKALTKYDYNRSHGNIAKYISTILDRTFMDMLSKRRAMKSMPRAVYFDCDNGEWEAKPTELLSLDESGPWAASEQEQDPIEQEEMDRLRKVFKMKMMNLVDSKGKFVISARGRLIFQCLVYPQDDFVKMIENEGGDPQEAPSIKQIARYINCDKNVVDFEITKIRRLATTLAESSEFSELFGGLVLGKGWPMIYMSDNKKEHDHVFVREIIARHKLDPRPLPDYATHKDHQQKLGDCWRLIERYAWGMVMVLKRGEECCTMVIEGKVNVLSGEVTGDHGQRKTIPLPWYNVLAKKLIGAKA